MHRNGWPPCVGITGRDRRNAHTYAAGLCESLHTGRDIHAIAKQIVTIDDHVSQADANTESNAFAFWHNCALLGEPALDLHRTFDSINSASEFSKRSIPSVLENAPIELPRSGVKYL